MTRRSLFATLTAAIAAPKLTPAALASGPTTATAVRVLEQTCTPVRYSVGFTVSRKAMEEEIARLRFIAESAEGVPLYLTDPDDWYLTPPTSWAEAESREPMPDKPHKWTGVQRGGDPADAGSCEWVRYCSVCGMEDTCEDPLPPCPGEKETPAD